MKKYIFKLKYKIKFYKKKFEIMIRLKSLIFNRHINKKYRNIFYLQYVKISNNIYESSFKNRCILNLTSNSVSRYFKLSRYILKSLKSNKYICGVSTVGW